MHMHISYNYRLFSVDSQSIVGCAFTAIASSSAIFLSALITSIIVLSIKGTWRKSIKVRRGVGSSQITTSKRPSKMLNDAYKLGQPTICYSCILPNDVLSGAVLYGAGFFPDHNTQTVH